MVKDHISHLTFRPFIWQTLSILSLSLLGVLSHYLYQSSGVPILGYLILIFIPLMSATILFWKNMFGKALTLVCIWFSIWYVISKQFQPFDYDAKYQTTKSNLKNLRIYIARYHENNNKYPIAIYSQSSNNFFQKNRNLNAILSNLNKHGDGINYTNNSIAGELISNPQGNDFICIVTNLKDYQSDQSHLNNCYNSDKNEIESYFGGGYLYYPKQGLIRLNFKVNRDNLLDEKQHNVGDLFSDWSYWISKNEDLNDDYPVRW